MYVDCTDKLFVFLKRRDAEPTNESERALRPSVIFRKVTNGFVGRLAPAARRSRGQRPDVFRAMSRC
jgi:hypothetical protein